MCGRRTSVPPSPPHTAWAVFFIFCWSERKTLSQSSIFFFFCTTIVCFSGRGPSVMVTPALWSFPYLLKVAAAHQPADCSSQQDLNTTFWQSTMNHWRWRWVGRRRRLLVSDIHLMHESKPVFWFHLKWPMRRKVRSNKWTLSHTEVSLRSLGDWAVRQRRKWAEKSGSSCGRRV